MCIFPPHLPTLWVNNIGVTYLTLNPHTHTKHMTIDFHFVWERVAYGHLGVKFIFEKDQPADIFTKPLVATKFATIRDKLTVSLKLIELEGAN